MQENDLRVSTRGGPTGQLRNYLAGGCLALMLMVGVIVFATVDPSFRTVPGSFFMIQLSDPQFGLQYSNVQWEAEQAMLNLSILTINRLAPRFIVLTGDLQNFLPVNTGNNWPMHKPNGSTHPGADEAAAIAQSLSLLDPAIPIRATIPGNHDIGYAPTLGTIDRFKRLWGEDHTAFDEAKIAFIAIDSQLYFNAS